MRLLKRIAGGMVTAASISLAVAFILSKAWFGLMIAFMIGFLGVMALVMPDEIFRSEPKALPTRGDARRAGGGESDGAPDEQRGA